jgi:hypothetical protein
LWTVTCPMSGSGLSPIHCWPSFLAICLLIVHGEISSLPLPSSLVHCQSSCLLYCVLVFSSLFIVHFFFFCKEGLSQPRVLCWFIPGVAGEYHVTLGTHLFGLPNVSQAGFGAGGCQWWQHICFLSIA